MNEVDDLLIALNKCIPSLDCSPLKASPPRSLGQEDIINWLYEHLSQQGLMVYEEWKEYFGWLPDLALLSDISLPEDPARYILSLCENIDESKATVHFSELMYMLPWLEHINFYLKSHEIRVVDILPFENAFILCVRNDIASMQQLSTCLKAFDMDINPRDPLDPSQTSAMMMSLLTE